jgi:hypothetical protein
LPPVLTALMFVTVKVMPPGPERCPRVATA